MSLMPEIANPYFEAFAVGVLNGLVFCTSTCLPYIASYIAGIGADFRKGVLITLIYNSGRITAYALVGGLIGILSGAFRLLIDETAEHKLRLRMQMLNKPKNKKIARPVSAYSQACAASAPTFKRYITRQRRIGKKFGGSNSWGS
jgi:hypothetical protein